MQRLMQIAYNVGQLKACSKFIQDVKNKIPNYNINKLFDLHTYSSNDLSG